MFYWFLFFTLIVIFLLRYNFFRIPKKGLVILLYHSIDNSCYDCNLNKFTIPNSKFEKQIKFLKKLGYSSIRASEIENFLISKQYLYQKRVLITFDDGYKNNLEAAKILAKYGYSAIFFISSAYIGKTLDNVSMLDEKDIQTLIDLGMEIGSHSHYHKKLSEISYNDIVANVKISKDLLSSFSLIEDFAYPFGAYSDTSIKVLRENGFKRAYIIGQSINTHNYNPYMLKRSIIRKSTNYLDLYLILTRGRSRI